MNELLSRVSAVVVCQMVNREADILGTQAGGVSEEGGPEGLGYNYGVASSLHKLVAYLKSTHW